MGSRSASTAPSPVMAPASKLGREIFTQGFRLAPTPLEAVTYYLRRLVTGEPLHELVRPFIHRADVYACGPADLARRFRPMPRTAGGDRFFFTAWKKGVRAAGPGSWVVQQGTKNIMDKEGPGGVTVGVLRKLRYKRGSVATSWLMDEFSACGLPGAVVGDMEYVFCKLYVSPRAEANDAAHRESAAFFALQAPPAVVVQPSPPGRMMPAGGNTVLAPRRPPAPPAAPSPTRAPLPAGQKIYFAPPQPFAPRRGSSTPSATQPSPASALSPALQVPTCPAVQVRRSPMPAQTPAAKRPAPPQAAMSPSPKRMRAVPVVQPAGGKPPQPPAQLAAAYKISLAPPPQPSEFRRSSPPPARLVAHPPPTPVQAPLPAAPAVVAPPQFAKRMLPAGCNTFLAPPQPPAPPAASARIPTCPAVQMRCSAAVKRPAPPQAAMSPCPKRMRGAMQPAPPQPLAPLAAVRKMPVAPPPQPSQLRRSSPPTLLLTQRSPTPVQAPAPRVPTRPAVKPRCSPMAAPPRRLAQPKQLMVQAYQQMSGQAVAPAWPCQPKQKITGDPFEDEDEDEDCWDELNKALGLDVPTAEAEKESPPSKDKESAAAALDDDDDWAELEKELGL